MINKIRSKIAAVVVGAALFAVPVAVAVPAVHAADVNTSLKCGGSLQLNAGEGCSGDTTSQGAGKINSLVTTVINVFSVVVGLVSVIMIIFGGFRYITSGGDATKVTGAKNTIVYAVIGLIVVAIAQFIVQFVLQKVTTING